MSSIFNIFTIYKVTNIINNKVYIGFDSNWPKRKSIHKCNSIKLDYKFYRAIRKHGWHNFKWEILYQSKDRDYTKNIIENQFIIEYDSFVNGYNSTMGGEGVFGLKRQFSNEERLHRSLLMKGNTIAKGNKGNKLSNTHKLNLSKAKKGKKIKPMTEQHKKNISLARRGLL
jgi:group I intron endonuclease